MHVGRGGVTGVEPVDDALDEFADVCVEIGVADLDLEPAQMAALNQAGAPRLP